MIYLELTVYSVCVNQSKSPRLQAYLVNKENKLPSKSNRWTVVELTRIDWGLTWSCFSWCTGLQVILPRYLQSRFIQAALGYIGCKSEGRFVCQNGDCWCKCSTSFPQCNCPHFDLDTLQNNLLRIRDSWRLSNQEFEESGEWDGSQFTTTLKNATCQLVFDFIFFKNMERDIISKTTEHKNPACQWWFFQAKHRQLLASKSRVLSVILSLQMMFLTAPRWSGSRWTGTWTSDILITSICMCHNKPKDLKGNQKQGERP